MWENMQLLQYLSKESQLIIYLSGKLTADETKYYWKGITWITLQYWKRAKLFFPKTEMFIVVGAQTIRIQI